MLESLGSRAEKAYCRLPRMIHSTVSNRFGAALVSTSAKTIPTADRILFLAAAAWGKADSERCLDRLNLDWRRRLDGAAQTAEMLRDAPDALESLRADHAAEARP